MAEYYLVPLAEYPVDSLASSRHQPRTLVEHFPYEAPLPRPSQGKETREGSPPQ